MVGTIGPVVHGRNRTAARSWILWYIGAHIAGSGGVGLIASILGHVVLPAGWKGVSPATLALGVAALAGSLRELGVVSFPLPSTGWQVPRHWSLLGPDVMARRYGFCLGTGLMTKVLHSTLYIALISCFLLADPPLGAAAMASYGLMRAIIVLAIIFRCHNLDDLHAKNFAIANRWHTIKAANGIVLVAFASHMMAIVAIQR